MKIVLSCTRLGMQFICEPAFIFRIFLSLAYQMTDLFKVVLESENHLVGYRHVPQSFYSLRCSHCVEIIHRPV